MARQARGFARTRARATRERLCRASPPSGGCRPRDAAASGFNLGFAPPPPYVHEIQGLIQQDAALPPGRVHLAAQILAPSPRIGPLLLI